MVVLIPEKLTFYNEMKIIIISFLSFFNLSIALGQDTIFTKSSIKVAFGLGFNEGIRELGFGTINSIGYQMSFFNNRLRLNPNLLNGTFRSAFITDIPDMYYRITSLELNVFLDAVKFKAVSLFVGAGGFVNYSRGLIGTGGDFGRSYSEYFFKVYGGGSIATGIRVNPKKSRFSFELIPVSLYAGNKSFSLGTIRIGIDIKI